MLCFKHKMCWAFLDFSRLLNRDVLLGDPESFFMLEIPSDGSYWMVFVFIVMTCF